MEGGEGGGREKERERGGRRRGRGREGEVEREGGRHQTLELVPLFMHASLFTHSRSTFPQLE